jgi:hypothetical protein
MAPAPPGGFLNHSIAPNITSLQVKKTTPSSLSLLVNLNFTNPTEYAATIPEISVLLSYNGTRLAYIIANELNVVPGPNSDMQVEIDWDPSGLSGDAGVLAGRRLLSRYISGEPLLPDSLYGGGCFNTNAQLGFNVTATIQTYEGSLRALPNLGRALSSIKLEVPVPRLRLDDGRSGDDGDDDHGDDDEPDRPHFIRDATVCVIH